MDKCIDVAQAAPDGEGESFSSRSPAENVLSLSKESTNLMTSGFSELSKEEFQQNDGLHERNFLAAGLEAPDKRMDDRVKQQVKIMFLKDYLVTRYVKCLRAIPTKLEETSEVITNACTDIMAFEGIITSSSHEGSSSDYSEAIRNILKAVGRLEALIEVLTKVRLSTESRLYLEGLGHLLHNT
ncbi:hypothetical protein MMC18_001925 [Xylographa bjoerkii]|nr:hypothetical protein [Xylographa bjoerkii]